MNITVYLGANEGNDPLLKEAVRELGTWIGSSGNTLIYGGGCRKRAGCRWQGDRSGTADIYRPGF